MSTILERGSVHWFKPNDPLFQFIEMGMKLTPLWFGAHFTDIMLLPLR